MLPSVALPFCSSPSSTQPSSKYMSNQCLKNICLKRYQIISCLNHLQAYIWSNLGQLSSFIPQYYSRCHGPYTYVEKHSGKTERDSRVSAGCSSPHSDWLPVTGKKKKKKTTKKTQLNVRLFTKYINLKYFKNFFTFLAVLGFCCSVQAFSSCSGQRLLFIAVRGLLIALASLAAKHGL